MAINIKKPEDIEILREGGRRHSRILRALAASVKPGLHTKDIDDMAARLIAEGGDQAAFLGYTPYGAKRPYPASVCVSVNDEIVHGIPNENDRVLVEGDIVSIDLGLIHEGMYTDAAVTVPVGKVSRDASRLLKAGKESLEKGIKAARAGNTTGHIGQAVEDYVMPLGFGIVRELAGHGLGYKVHEDPYVPNYGLAGEGDELVPGMVIAIEPMLTTGTERIKLDKDGYTYRTTDGSLAVHFEHTVLITENGPEILTK